MEDGVKTLEEMNLTSQTDLRKIDSKVRKVKNLLDTSMEGLEEKINFPIGELSCKLETKIQENQAELESEQTALKRRFDEFENVDVVNMTRRIATARNKINDIIEKTSEIDLQIKEIHRDKSSNLLLHGLTCTEGESLESLVKTISDIIRTKLGMGREMSLVSAHRLTCTRVEVNSCPPVLMSFEHVHDRDSVLAKINCLDKNSGIVVSSYSKVQYSIV